MGWKRVGSGTLRSARRAVVLVVGLSVVAAGLVLVVLPGPAILVIPAGLGILALEFAWARRLLRRARDAVVQRETDASDAAPPDN